MTKLVKTLLLAGIASTVAATSALAQNPFIQVDENGKMTINGNPGPPGVRAIEPISGLQALCYQLPGFAGNPGDVVIFGVDEPGGVNALSDLIRFPGNGNMYFFSLIDDTNEPPDLADVPALPPAINPNVFIQENGPEGNNNVIWQPGPGGIGGSDANPNLEYNFISDVPEPSALALTVMGGGLLVALRLALRRRPQGQRS